MPYSPDYKVAPEWHPVLEIVQQQLQQHQVQAAADPSHHLQVHKRIMSHAALEHLKVADAAHHVRLAAAAAAADAAISSELKHNAPSKVLIGVHFAEVQPADLQRLKVQQQHFHPAAAAASDWAEPLQAVVMATDRSREHQQLCQPELVAVSPWELDVAVCPQVRVDTFWGTARRWHAGGRGVQRIIAVKRQARDETVGVLVFQ